MEIHLFNNSDRVPKPKHEIRIEELKATPYPDRFRVFIEVKVTPFLERPNLLLYLHDAHDRLVGELNVIETMHADMEFTMHLRGMQDPAGEYSLTAELFYENRSPVQDKKVVGFVVPKAENA
jgi:hypothetical protein